jgi:hypothetical protein
MENNNNEIISRLMIAKANLDAVPKELLNEQFIAIQNAINQYIIDHCIHSIVSDDIDVDCDNSISIHYCEHCYQTFTRQ